MAQIILGLTYLGEGNTSLFESNNNSLKSFPSTRAKIVQMTRNYHVKEEVEWYINNHVEFLVVIFEFFLNQCVGTCIMVALLKLVYS